MYVINVADDNVCSSTTNCAPNQSKVAMVTIPKNSLSGEARLFLFPILLDKRNNLLIESLNLLINKVAKTVILKDKCQT